MKSRNRILAPALIALGVLCRAAPGLAAQATTEGNMLVYRDVGQTIVVQAWGRDGLRVRVVPEGGRQTSDWALDLPLERKGEIRISDADAVIRNGKISARIANTPVQQGHMQFFRHRGDRADCILSEHDYGWVGLDNVSIPGVLREYTKRASSN